MADTLKKGGYYDTPFWGKITNPDGSEEKIMAFPITRYANILGKPVVATNASTLGTPEFALLKTEELEIPDEEIFDRANQSW